MPIGSGWQNCPMLKPDTRPRHRNAGRPAEKDAPAFLQWIRGRPCAFASSECYGKIEAMHLDFAGGKGVGTKVADRFSLPACAGHHAEQHYKGWQTFRRRMGVTEDMLLAAAAKFWRDWPGRPAWERKQEL